MMTPCKFYFALLVPIAFFTGAHAQTPDIRALQLCKVLKNDVARLSCFDNAISALSNEQSDLAAKREIKWKLVEDKSPIDDSAQTLAALDAIDGKGVFVIRCREKTVDVFFSPSEYIGSGEERRVIYRINEGQAVETRWSSSTNGKAVFVPSPNVSTSFLLALPDNGSLFVRLFDFRGVPHDATFKLGNVSEITTKVVGTCGARSRQPGATKK
jgi:hypothetical protein